MSWCYLYYYAFFHTYKQHKLQKIWCYGPRNVQDMVNWTFAVTLVAQSDSFRVKRCRMPAAVCSQSNYPDHH